MFGEIRNSYGENLEYFYAPGTEGDDRIVVLGHGVTGNMDRGVMTGAEAALQSIGIASLRFSFAGNGGSEGRFQDCTISKEVEDLGAVVVVVSTAGRTIAYGGHSMGGAVGVMRAATDDRIRLLVSFAGMVETQKFAQAEFGEANPDAGYMWDEECCPLSSTYMNDMASIGSIVELGAEIRVPWLLLHGSEDDVVPIQDSIDIEAKATCSRKFVTIEGADHSFSEHQSQMREALGSWVSEQFG